jgi:hypothetical protein
MSQLIRIAKVSTYDIRYLTHIIDIRTVSAPYALNKTYLIGMPSY